MNAASPVALLLVTLLLSGCEAPEAPPKTAPARTVREAITPALVPAPEQKPESLPQQDSPQPPVEQHTARPLKLTIDNDLHSGQRPRTFGTASRPDWLDAVAAGSEAADKLLPDLFDTQADGKAVSVKGKVLTTDDGKGLSPGIDGAGVNLQIQTD